MDIEGACWTLNTYEIILGSTLKSAEFWREKYFSLKRGKNEL